jgi:hypothetical protein
MVMAEMPINELLFSPMEDIDESSTVDYGKEEIIWQR